MTHTGTSLLVVAVVAAAVAVALHFIVRVVGM